MKNQPHVGLSLMLESAFAANIHSVLEAGVVDAIEWSFDVGWSQPGIPAWAEQLISFYAQNGRLYGHGVTYSMLSGKQSERQNDWLRRFQQECRSHQYQHITEHFGFITAGNFHDSAPLPVPLNGATLAAGQTRLKQLAAIAECPVGLENLAFAFGLEDVRRQGEFLEQLLAPVDGFLLLDLHNLYCQAVNFNLDAAELLMSYPLHRVRELHVSGGSWSKTSTGEMVRRDTHDDAVPEEVFELVPKALANCPNVELVILERLGNTLADKDTENFAAGDFAAEFRRLRGIVEDHSKRRTQSTIANQKSTVHGTPSTFPDEKLAAFQTKLLEILYSEQAADEIMEQLKQSTAISPYRDYVTSFDPKMVEVAASLLKKWGRRD